MDLSLFDALPPSPLFDDRVDDVLASSAAFMLDPFTATPHFGDDANLPPPRTQLLLDPFDSPPMPLAPAAPPLSPAPCAAPLVPASPDVSLLAPPPPPLLMPASPEPQQENVPANMRGVHPRRGDGLALAAAPSHRPNVCATPGAPAGGGARVAGAGAAGVNAAAVAAAVSAEQRSKDKLAQRKLRNKESARRYREKQVARRRQLESYTRTLSEQNRELEILHHKLLTLTCQRSMRAGAHLSDVAPRVL